jgi:hypothetical protein
MMLDLAGALRSQRGGEVVHSGAEKRAETKRDDDAGEPALVMG